MTKQELIHYLEIAKESYGYDLEIAHMLADDLLIDYIDDEDIRNAYSKILKKYA